MTIPLIVLGLVATAVVVWSMNKTLDQNVELKGSRDRLILELSKANRQAQDAAKEARHDLAETMLDLIVELRKQPRGAEAILQSVDDSLTCVVSQLESEHLLEGQGIVVSYAPAIANK